MLITLAIVFGVIASPARDGVERSCGAPDANACGGRHLVYCFIGAIIPAHLLVVVAALGFALPLLRPKT